MVTLEILNPVFNPILNLGPFWAIILMSFLVSLIISIVYKLTTDQKKMKEIKDEIKSFQDRAKAEKEDPNKMMAIQKEAMSKNMEYMKMSFKPTLFTFIPILLIFGWMADHLAYEPLIMSEQFNVEVMLGKEVAGTVKIVTHDGLEVVGSSEAEIKDGKVNFMLKGLEKGDFTFDVDFNNRLYSKEVRITDKFSYLDPIRVFDEGDVKQIVVGNQKVKPLGSFSILGWRPEWLGTYIIFSLVFSMLIRKALKVY